MPNEEDISRLLRLKRYEQPPPGYFDDFLREFQMRQRAELIRRPLWEIMRDRLASLLPSFEVPRLAYASVAALAVAASAAIVIVPSGTPASQMLVSAAPAAAETHVSLSSPAPVTIEGSVPVALASTGAPSIHYVLPTRPVSYASARGF